MLVEFSCEAVEASFTLYCKPQEEISDLIWTFFGFILSNLRLCHLRLKLVPKYSRMRIPELKFQRCEGFASCRKNLFLPYNS